MSLPADPGHRDFYWASCLRVLELSEVRPPLNTPSFVGFQPTVPFYGPNLVTPVPRSFALIAGREGGRTSTPSLYSLATTVSGFRRRAFNRELDTEPTLVNSPRKQLILL